MKIASILIASILLLTSTSLYAYREMVRLEEALEVDKLNIKLDPSGNGYITGSMCEACATIKVKITPKTVAIEKKTIVPLKEAKKRAGKPAFVIFDPKSLEVVKIRW